MFEGEITKEIEYKLEILSACYKRFINNYGKWCTQCQIYFNMMDDLLSNNDYYSFNMTDYEKISLVSSYIIAYRNELEKRYHKMYSLEDIASHKIALMIKQNKENLNNIPHSVIELVIRYLKNNELKLQLIYKGLDPNYYINNRIINEMKKIPAEWKFYHVNRFDLFKLSKNFKIFPKNINHFAEIILYFLKNKLYGQTLCTTIKKLLTCVRMAKTLSSSCNFSCSFDELCGFFKEFGVKFEYNIDNLIKVFMFFISKNVKLYDKIKSNMIEYLLELVF